MLQRIRVRGYKSFRDLEVSLPRLGVLFGPNAAGKTNLFNALQLLSKLGTSTTIEEAFAPPYRGNPIESFTVGDGGIRSLLAEDRLSFSIEADLVLSDRIVESAHRQIAVMRHPNGRAEAGAKGNTPGPVRERSLRYRIEIEMLPKSGRLRVADEYLAALNRRGEPTRRRLPFLERRGGRLHLRPEGRAPATAFDGGLDRSILSMPHYPPHHPHLVAARRELENWRFHNLEPRERMRIAGPVREVRRLGSRGEDRPAFLRTLRALEPRQSRALEKALGMLVPGVSGIEVEANDRGEVELRLREDGAGIPAGVMSEGTLRMLGLLASTGFGEPPTLVGVEEPENGVHPRRMDLIAEFLKTRATVGRTQFLVTTHSPLLLDRLPPDTLYAVRRVGRDTRISPLREWGPLWFQSRMAEGRRDAANSELPVSQRLLRGDFDDGERPLPRAIPRRPGPPYRVPALIRSPSAPGMALPEAGIAESPPASRRCAGLVRSAVRSGP